MSVGLISCVNTFHLEVGTPVNHNLAAKTTKTKQTNPQNRNGFQILKKAEVQSASSRTVVQTCGVKNKCLLMFYWWCFLKLKLWCVFVMNMVAAQRRSTNSHQFVLDCNHFPKNPFNALQLLYSKGCIDLWPPTTDSSLSELSEYLKKIVFTKMAWTDAET